jgi:uncharacterized protein (DUF1330 family)
MPSYVIANVDVHDAQMYERYKELTPTTIEAHGGRFIVRAGAVTELEGQSPFERLVIMEFPDAEAARAWYDSPEYQSLKALRSGAAAAQFMLVDGVA